ncbi:hypothetical protein [Phage f2b1]|nr:hypothetical protein [Phage f2b1]
MGIRRTLYIRPTKDEDIMDYLKPLLEREEFSLIVRELIRDGIKYRSLSYNPPTQPSASPVHFQNNTGIQSNTPDFSEIKLEKKEVDPEELDKRLDDF